MLGFMGDEPSFPGVPYTARIYDEFERRKGYDIRPHLAQLFVSPPTEESRRMRADYWDVWTDLYRDNFFGLQAEWCAREKLEFLMHLCGEEDMRTLLALNGDFFKCLRPVQVPGVDAIWRQIWPDKIADYAKLASSVAHLQGRPRSFSEGYAVYGRGLSVEQAKWVLDHHLVRGINLFQTMSFLSSREGFRPYFCPPDLNLSPQWPHFAQLFAYGNRMSYLLSVGVPAAAIGLYYPTTSGWLGDFEADRSGLAIARQLLEQQRDFDFVDEDSLQHVLKIESGALVNRSGQRYRAFLIPPLKVISAPALAQLEAFARSGGQVIFLGRLPELVVGRSYREAAPGPKELPWGFLEPRIELTAGVLSRLPAPDVVLQAGPGQHRPAVREVSAPASGGRRRLLPVQRGVADAAGRGAARRDRRAAVLGCRDGRQAETGRSEPGGEATRGFRCGWNPSRAGRSCWRMNGVGRKPSPWISTKPRGPCLWTQTGSSSWVTGGGKER